mmetsp:Transcript_20935/g.52086  ORF Transcript_20935/g.52086 Transcript_20935/m.52086 type:complete len:340 (-) Transcript_20935:181-1200(-)
MMTLSPVCCVVCFAFLLPLVLPGRLSCRRRLLVQDLLLLLERLVRGGDLLLEDVEGGELDGLVGHVLHGVGHEPLEQPADAVARHDGHPGVQHAGVGAALELHLAPDGVQRVAAAGRQRRGQQRRRGDALRRAVHLLRQHLLEHVEGAEVERAVGRDAHARGGQPLEERAGSLVLQDVLDHLPHGLHVGVHGQPEADDVQGIGHQSGRARGGGAGQQTRRDAQLARFLVGELLLIELVRVEHGGAVRQDADHLRHVALPVPPHAFALADGDEGRDQPALGRRLRRRRLLVGAGDLHDDLEAIQRCRHRLGQAPRHTPGEEQQDAGAHHVVQDGHGAPLH